MAEQEDLKDLKQVLHEIGAKLKPPAQTGVEGLWTWEASVQDLSFSKSIELNPYVKLNESTVRKRIQDLLSDDETRKVRKMHELHLTMKEEKKAATASSVLSDLRVYIEDHSCIVYTKVFEHDFFACMGKILAENEAINTFAIDVEGPARDPVFLQVAWRPPAVSTVYHAILVVFESNSYLDDFEEKFQKLMEGKRVVCWGAPSGTFECNLSTTDAQSGPYEKVSRNTVFARNFTIVCTDVCHLGVLRDGQSGGHQEREYFRYALREPAVYGLVAPRSARHRTSRRVARAAALGYITAVGAIQERS